jgi:aldehyde dehydrogenase (NAD+)
VITTFNFPVAVWAWNAALALVCGDPVIWKPSEKTPLTALAIQALVARAVEKFGDAPQGLSAVLIGNRDAATRLTEDPRVPLVSATGSTRMGRTVGPLAQRFARAILELGGNNAAVVCPSADLELDAARDCLCGHRHFWPALHHASPAVYTPSCVRSDRRAAEASVCDSARRQSA